MRQPAPASYEFVAKFRIPEVKRDASAITLHTGTGHLWVVVDDRERLVEFTDDGQFVRKVKLKGFNDTEGLCYLGGDRFAIAEEGAMRITVVEIPPEADAIGRDDYCIEMELDAKAKKNKGLEGVTYHRADDALFAVREDKPPTVFRIEPLLGEEESMITELPLDLDGLDDLSDAFFDATTNLLWLLSHESRLAIAYDEAGQASAALRLEQGRHNLPEDVKQAEGIVRDRRGRLLVCSEPNDVYCFFPSG